MFANTVTMRNNDNVLVIFASPHSNGHTAKFLREFLQGQNIAKYNFFDCFKANPKPCNACGGCDVKTECTHRDLDDFYKMLKSATRIIFAFPIYNAGPPAPLKALIDRLQIYYCARFVRGVRPPISTPKLVDIITTCGNDKSHEDVIKAQILPALTVINGKLDIYSEVCCTDNERI